MWPNEMTAKGPKICFLTWTDDRNSEESEALFQDVQAIIIIIIEQLVGIEHNLVLCSSGNKGSGCKLKIGACCICMARQGGNLLINHFLCFLCR